MIKITSSKFCFLLLFITFSTISFSQTVLNYNTWTGASGCNIFSDPNNASTVINVPATVNGTNTTIAHLTAIGQPTYDNTNKTVNLVSEIKNGSQNQGTEYRITVNFKQNYSYKITITAMRTMSQQMGANVLLRTDLNSGGSGSNNLCNGTGIIDANGSGNLKQSLQVTNSSFSNTPDTNYVFNYASLSAAQTYLMIAAIPPAASVYQTILIRRIKIEETPPAVSFNITPASVPITCGSTTPVTFTVNNVGGTTGITNYTWNLGTTPNGWLLPNGTAAPATYSTGLTNTLALTPVCGSVQKNISATVTANGNNYNTNTSIVSITQPTLSINGSNAFCSGNPVYSVTNLPCNATVNWSATPPSGIVTVGCPSCPTTTLTKVGDGQVTLTATITACGGTQTVTKGITVGLAPITGQLYTSPYNSYYLNPSQTSYYICFTQRDISLNFQGATNLVAYAYSGPYVTSVVGTTIYWAYDSYNYSQTLRIEYDVACGHVVRVLSFYNTCSGYYYRISPNPSSTEVTVFEAKPDKGKAKGQKTITELNLYDGTGSLRKHQVFGKVSKVVLNVSDLPAGVYYLEIVDGVYKERQKLVIGK